MAMPPIAPGKRMKIEVYNTGHDLITTVTYPDNKYSLCAWTLFLLMIALLGGIYYYVQNSSTGEKEPSKDSTITPETSIKSDENSKANENTTESNQDNKEDVIDKQEILDEVNQKLPNEAVDDEDFLSDEELSDEELIPNKNEKGNEAKKKEKKKRRRLFQ